jgi:hypothetical protein
MPTEPIPESFLKAFGNVTSQGDQFNDRISPDGWYYAFLSKLDPHYAGNDGKGLQDGLTVTFEIAPRAYIENSVLRTDSQIRIFPRNIPASLLQFDNVLESDLRLVLKLRDTDPLAEGEWYLVQLENPPAKGISAVMVDPDID